MTHTAKTILVDTRPMASKDRGTLVFVTFDQLAVNETMELVNDHDPVRLRSQFELEKPNLFSWEYMESGPELWRVVVTKLKGKHGVDRCCGVCGG